MWSAVANIQFQLVTYNAADPSQIVFRYEPYGSAATATSYAASGNDPSPGQPVLGVTTSEITTFDPPQIGISTLDSFTAFGGYGIDTVIHEEGHLLGLGHAGPYNGAVDPATQQLGPYDTRQWSLMSYINPTDTSAEYASSYPDPGTDWGVNAQGYALVSTTWMPLDILAAQRLYGLPTTTPLSGGQVFGFNTNIAAPIGQFFDFTVNTAPVVTLWDEGANNTLDVSGFAAAGTVDLRQGGFSSVDGMVNNIAIAFDTQIDTAIGGPGNTVFIVNADSDRIAGGSGANQADFVAGGLNAIITGTAGALDVAWAGGVDTLAAVAAIDFAGSGDTVSSSVGLGLTLGAQDVLFLTAAASAVTLSNADTLVANAGQQTITAAGTGGSGGNLVFGEGPSTLMFYGGASADTIVATRATVQGGAAGLVVFGNAGASLDYLGGEAASTVVGGAGSTTAQGGAGGLLVGGSAGANVLDGGAGPNTLFGAGNGDLLVLANGTTNYAVLGAGTETVQAGAAWGEELIYLYGNAGVAQGGTGTNIFTAGHGNATLTGGDGGTNLFLFIDGQGGGSDIITTWGAPNDWVELYGFGAGVIQQAAAGAVHQNGDTVMTLPDGTHVTFLAAAVSTAQFFT